MKNKKDNCERDSIAWGCLISLPLLVLFLAIIFFLAFPNGLVNALVASAEEVRYTFTSQTYVLPCAVTLDNVTTSGNYNTALMTYSFVYSGSSVYVVVNGDTSAREVLSDSSPEYVEQLFVGNAMIAQSGLDYAQWNNDSRCYNSVWMTCNQAIFEKTFSGRVSSLTFHYGELPTDYLFHSGTEDWQEGGNLAWVVTMLFDTGSLSASFYIPAPAFEETPSDIVVTVPDEQFNAGYSSGVSYADSVINVDSASYNKGYNVGKTDGYNLGYSNGTSSGKTWFSYLAGVAQAPIDFLKESLSFEILGVSMYDFVCSLLAICGVVIILKVVGQ